MTTPKTTISVRKAADIPRFSIGSGAASTQSSHIDAASPTPENFGALSSFSDDFLAPSKATKPRAYAHVEMITYVIDGYFKHDDTLGSDFVLQHGDVERFAFGSGAGFMATNGSDTAGLRMIALGIDARDATGPQGIEHLSLKRSADGLDQPLIDVAVDDTQAASPAMSLHQRGRIAVGLPGGFRDRVHLGADYGVYIYAISGSVAVDNVMLAEGDAATITETDAFAISGTGIAHALIAVVPLRDYGNASQRDVNV